MDSCKINMILKIPTRCGFSSQAPEYFCLRSQVTLTFLSL